MNFHNALREGRIQLCEVEGNMMLLRSYRLASQPSKAYLYAELPTSQYNERLLKVTDYQLVREKVIISFLVEWDDEQVITLTAGVKVKVVTFNPPQPGFVWDDEQSNWINSKGSRVYNCP
jgi:hypothetical protein